MLEIGCKNDDDDEDDEDDEDDVFGVVLVLSVMLFSLLLFGAFSLLLFGAVFTAARKKDGSPMTSEAGEIMDKKVEYETIASSDSSVNLDDIDNKIITEVLGPERYGRVRFQGSGVNPTQYFGFRSQQYMPLGSQAQSEVQRLRDQMAQIQVRTVEQIAQLKAEAASREVEVQRNYEEL
ncbi:hypothetical protein J1N35_021765 [Gossypium stocksii]|uniref:Uncharacterized protein n=1 Tax=Gossypium stocksii TaxID=47602 RepID=A0A9D3VGF7_9ROSI|nr:hypothetical protein J1N35_021765 [Gossypium stocksii]